MYSAIGIRNVYLSLEGNYKPFTETIDSLFSYFNRIIQTCKWQLMLWSVSNHFQENPCKKYYEANAYFQLEGICGRFKLLMLFTLTANFRIIRDSIQKIAMVLHINWSEGLSSWHVDHSIHSWSFGDVAILSEIFVHYEKSFYIGR